MAIKRITQGLGLHTERSAVDSEPGAMRTADNVMIRRPGIIEPRPGFGDATGVADLTSDLYLPVRGWPYGSDVVVQMRDPDGAWKLAALSDLDNLGAHAPPSNRGSSDAAEARGSLYVTSSTGVQKIEGASTAAELAGVRTDYHTVEAFARIGVTGVGGASDRFAVDETSSVAYRYCWMSRDANDYERRSAPSPRVVMRNSSALGYYITVSRVYLPTGIAAGDFFELYRTVNSNDNAIDPGDECYLVTAHAVTAAEVTAGYIDVGAVWDQVMDDELGPALYTNPSRGGIVANANEIPPLARAVEHWSDVLWYGHTTERAVLTIEPVSVYSPNNDEHDLDGVHYSTKTGDVSAPSPLIVNVSNVNGVKVGQYITDAGYPVLNDGTEVQESDRTYVTASTKVSGVYTLITLTNNTNIDTATPDAIVFSNLSSVTATARIVWDASLASGTMALKGANLGESADNLATAINASSKEIWGAGALTAVSDSVDTVQITSADGHGIPVSFTESTPGTYTVEYRILMDAAAKGTGTTQSFDVSDYIVVNDQELYFDNSFGPIIAYYESPYSAISGGLPAWQSISINTARTGTTTNLDLTSELARYLGDGINAHAIRGDLFNLRAYVDDIAPIRNQWNTISQESPGPSAVTLIATDFATSLSFSAPVRPDSFRVSSSGSVTSLDATVPGRLFWSKPNEPEAVPVVNFVDVGDNERAILALVALEDALIVFKEDGIYRVTGSAPSSWVVDDLDLSARLLSPRCVGVLENVAYAWTDRGLLAVTEGGVVPVPVSAAIGDRLRAKQTLLPRGNADGQRGFWLEVHQRRGLVVLAVADAADDEYSDEQYIWHRATGAWTRWTRADRCMVYDPAEDRMLACPAGGDGYTVAAVNSFSASNYYSIATGNDLDGSAAFTRSVLFRYDAAPTATETLMEQQDTDGGWLLYFITGGELRWRIYDSGSTAYTTAVSSGSFTTGSIYAVTCTWDGTNLRAVVNQTATNTTPGCTYNQATAQSPTLGASSGGSFPATSLTILGAAASDSTALSEAQAQTHNAACIASGRMESFTGVENIWRAPDLDLDAVGSLDWTENGSPAATTIAWDARPLALYERTDETAAASYVDASAQDLTIYSTSTTTITISQEEFGGHVPSACDLVRPHDSISDSGPQVWLVVTSVATSGSFFVLTVDGTLSGYYDDCDWRQGWASVMQWQAQQLGGLGQRWQEMHVALEETASAHLTAPEIDIGGAAHRDSAATYVSPAMPLDVTYSETVRVGVPRACVRTQHLYPYVRVCGAGLLWRLADVHLHHSTTSRRVAR